MLPVEQHSSAAFTGVNESGEEVLQPTRVQWHSAVRACKQP
jgi:hypothetical protein